MDNRDIRESTNELKQTIEEAILTLEKEPKGELHTELVEGPKGIDPKDLESITHFYHAIFGASPWAIVREQGTEELYTWHQAVGLLETGISLEEDPRYSKEAIKQFLKDWFQQEDSFGFYEKDEDNNTYSFCAWFSHQRPEDAVDQIQRENGTEEEIAQQLKKAFNDNCQGQVIYVADMATHPKVRESHSHTMTFWTQLFTQISDVYQEKQGKEGITITLRTSAQDGAPLFRILSNLFKGVEPVLYEEKEQIVYFAVPFSHETMTKIGQALITRDRSSFREVLRLIAKR